MTMFEIIGHRGTNPYPDHSREAHEAALDWGADMAELDVQMTADGVLVVAHDVGSIPTLTYAELHKKDQHIMTVEEALDLITAKSIETGRSFSTSIEIKAPAVYARYGLDPAAALVDLLKEKNFYGPQVSIASFDHATAERISTELLPAAGITASIDATAYSISVKDLAAMAKWTDSISVRFSSISQELVDVAHSHGVKVYAWTHYTTGEDLQGILDMGVDGVYTDVTRVAVEYVNAQNGTNVVYGNTNGGTVSGTEGDDLIFALQGDDVVIGGRGNDTLNGDGGNDILSGGEGNDILRGGAGADLLLAEDGADKLYGNTGNDVIVSKGNSSIYYSKGDGIDLIQGQRSDKIFLQDVDVSDISVTFLGSSLVLRVGDGALIFENAWTSLPDKFEFSDGTILDASRLRGMSNWHRASDLVAAVADLRETAKTADHYSDLEARPNLVYNGSFENTDGTLYRSWGRYDPDGIMPGWVNLASGRVEQHLDTVGHLYASEGSYWTDMDGWKNNVQLAQHINGVETGATYRLSFDLADQDLSDNEILEVTYGGVTVFKGAPTGANWQSFSFEIKGGQGNGSDTVIFAQKGGSLDGYGLALDNIAMIKVADAAVPMRENLIVNGSFEDISGTSYRSWGRYDPNGIMPGWHNAGSGRVEQHSNTVNGVSASHGAYWTDMDGWKNNVELVQKVAGVEAGARYELSFDLADTDLDDDETLVVTFGGETVWQGSPHGAKWETISLNLIGGSGDGSNVISFSQKGGSLDGDGLALDNISMIKYEQDFDPINVQSWGKGADYAGFNATYRLTLTEDDLSGGFARAWEIVMNNDKAHISNAWVSGFGGSVSLSKNEQGHYALGTAGQAYQKTLHAGDTITFTVQGRGADFDAQDMKLVFRDLDTIPDAKDSQECVIEVQGAQTWHNGLSQSMSIVNDGEKTIDFWAVELDHADAEHLVFNSVWGATAHVQEDGDVIFVAENWNGVLQAGHSATFGFNAQTPEGTDVTLTADHFVFVDDFAFL